MNPTTRTLGILLLLLGYPGGAEAADLPRISFKSSPGQVAVLVGGQPLAKYCFQDEKTTRPYFTHLRAPGGMLVTRNHPPVEGTDLTDHATLHPGLWLAFGDLSGADSWRNRARVQHDRFIEEPGRGSFAVRNRYLSADGKQTLCQETCRYTFLIRPAGYLILWDSEFRSEDREFAFGDQEEMGLGIRVATPLSVKQGGRILLSSGEQNERQVRGKQADWCDYSGTIDDRRFGITLMPHPANFRPCWYHARDYGFVAANPFGRKALTRGEVSRVVVKRGETLRLRFGVLLHAAPTDKPVDLPGAYKDYLKLSADP